MPIFLRIALLIDLGSIWIEESFPRLHGVGFLSTNHAIRLLILLLGAAILLEFCEILKPSFRGLVEFLRNRRHPPEA